MLPLLSLLFWIKYDYKLTWRKHIFSTQNFIYNFENLSHNLNTFHNYKSILFPEHLQICEVVHWDKPVKAKDWKHLKWSAVKEYWTNYSIYLMEYYAAYKRKQIGDLVIETSVLIIKYLRYVTWKRWKYKIEYTTFYFYTAKRKLLQCFSIWVICVDLLLNQICT